VDKERQQGYIRERLRDLEPFESSEAEKSYALYVSHARAIPLGHTEITVGTSAVGLPLPAQSVKRTLLYAIGNPLYFCDDGTDPSSSHGFPIPEDTVFIYDSDTDEDFKLWAASSTEVRVAFYG
jgi:hypothetical protein